MCVLAFRLRSNYICWGNSCMFILCLDCDQCRVCAFLLGAGSFLKFHLTKTFDDPEKINRPTAQSWKCYPPPPRKLAWQREIHRLKMYFLLEDGNFPLACYLFVESCQKLPWPETCQKDGPSQMKSQEFRKTVSRRALPIFLMEWCSCLLDVFFGSHDNDNI